MQLCRSIKRYDASDQFDASLIDELRGTPWQPVPGRESLKIPTNIETNGQVINDDGDVDGYVEEDQNTEERFNTGVDETQDENIPPEHIQEEEIRSKQEENQTYIMNRQASAFQKKW